MKTADKCGVDVKIGRFTQRIGSGFRKSVIPTACSFLPNQENNILPGDGETATGNRLKRGVLSTRQSSCLERYMFATASETAKGLRLDEPSMTPIMRDQGKMMSIGNTMDRYRGAVRDEVAENTFARFALSHVRFKPLRDRRLYFVADCRCSGRS